MNSHAGNSKTYKPAVEDCIAIDVTMLRKAGMLEEWMDHRVSRQWGAGGHLVGDLMTSTTFSNWMTGPVLSIEGEAFGARIQQTLQLTSRRMRFGGKRWYILCPATLRPCCKLILPPGGDCFASLKAWRLGYRSQRVDAVTQAQRATAALQRRLSGFSPRTRQKTITGLAQRIEAKEAFLDQVAHFCEYDLARGRRMSLRRAVRASRLGA